MIVIIKKFIIFLTHQLVARSQKYRVKFHDCCSPISNTHWRQQPKMPLRDAVRDNVDNLSFYLLIANITLVLDYCEKGLVKTSKFAVF